MDILIQAQAILNDAKQRVKTSNFYFHTHQCPETGENVKVKLDYRVRLDTDVDCANFGLCPHCKTLYYHLYEDSKSF